MVGRWRVCSNSQKPYFNGCDEAELPNDLFLDLNRFFEFCVCLEFHQFEDCISKFLPKVLILSATTHMQFVSV